MLPVGIVVPGLCFVEVLRGFSLFGLERIEGTARAASGGERMNGERRGEEKRFSSPADQSYLARDLAAGFFAFLAFLAGFFAFAFLAAGFFLVVAFFAFFTATLHPLIL